MLKLHFEFSYNIIRLLLLVVIINNAFEFEYNNVVSIIVTFLLYLTVHYEHIHLILHQYKS